MAAAGWGCGLVAAFVVLGLAGVFWSGLGLPGSPWLWSGATLLWLAGFLWLPRLGRAWLFWPWALLPLAGLWGYVSSLSRV